MDDKGKTNACVMGCLLSEGQESCSFGALDPSCVRRCPHARCRCEEGWIQRPCVGRCPSAHRMVERTIASVCRAHRAEDATDDVAQQVTEYLLRTGNTPFRRRNLRKLAKFKLRDWMKSPGGGARWHRGFGNAISVDDPDVPELPDRTTEGEEEYTVEDLERMFDAFPEHQREVVARRHGVFGFPVQTFDEIARAMTEKTGKRWSRDRAMMTYVAVMERLRKQVR